MPAPDVGEASIATVRLATAADVPAVARSLSESFDVSVWARIGGRSAEAYVSHFVRDPREFLVVAEHRAYGIVGACLATTRLDTHRRSILVGNSPRFAAALARDVIRDPNVAVTMGRRVASGFAGRILGRVRPSDPPARVEHVELGWPLEVTHPGYIAGYFVSPRARGLQLAARMSTLAVDVFRKQAFEWAEVHTYTDNIASQQTATRAGFRLVRRHGTHLTYRLYLGEGSPGDMSVRIVDDPGAEPEFENEWARLVSCTPDGSGFHAWGWIAAHIDETTTMRIGIVTLGQRWVGIFPMRLDRGGRLCFIAERRSNYCGPVYDPEHLATVLAGFREVVSRLAPRAVDLAGMRERSPFYAAARRLVLGQLGDATVVNTNGCPEVELDAGWDAVWHRHRSKHRGNWLRAERRLAQLGAVSYEELTDADRVIAAMPAAVRLYERRWSGLNVDKAFGEDQVEFQREAARSLAPRGHVSLCVLRLEGEIIAFSYQLRANGVSSSYTLAHDDRYAPYSPGQLLLIRVLAQAAARGDPMFDFSVGDEGYKDIWCTRRQEVFRVLWGAGSRRAAAASTLRVRLRARPELRRIKQQGLRALVPRRRRATHPRWHLQWLSPNDRAGVDATPMQLREMRALLDDETFRIAIDRGFRGDVLLLVRDRGEPTIALWKVAQSRRATATRGLVELEEEHGVFVQPIVLRRDADLPTILGGLGPGVLVSPEPILSPVLASFEGELT